MNDKLINWLNTQLEERGWSQRELARRTGLSHTAISTVLNSQRNPGWDFCAAIARTLGEPPENVFRMAGLLPSVSLPAYEAKEVLYLFQSLPEDLRTIALTIMRALQLGPEMIAETRPPYRSQPAISLELDAELSAFLSEFPELQEIIDDARHILSETALRALITNVRIFSSRANEREEFASLHRQLSDMFNRYIE